jgi:hypothetical protein
MRSLVTAFLLVVPVLAEEPVCRAHRVVDLRGGLWPAALAHVRAAAAGAEIGLERDGLVLSAAPAVHDRVARAIEEARESLGRRVTVEVHVVKLKEPGDVASVPAREIDRFLRARCERIATHVLECPTLQRVTAVFRREITYLGDFDLEVGGGSVRISDPIVEVAEETWTVNLKPVLAGGKVRVAADFSIKEIRRPIPEFQTLLAGDLPATIQLPEERSAAVSREATCHPDAFVAVDLGDSTVALLRATVAPKDE